MIRSVWVWSHFLSYSISLLHDYWNVNAALMFDFGCKVSSLSVAFDLVCVVGIYVDCSLSDDAASRNGPSIRIVFGIYTYCPLVCDSPSFLTDSSPSFRGQFITHGGCYRSLLYHHISPTLYWSHYQNGMSLASVRATRESRIA